MGVQITISGKLRGDRSAFEKHTAGILPRAGHHADIIVAEDIAHVKTAMGLIGIKIRIARKEKVVPEFELKEGKTKKVDAKQEVDADSGESKDEKTEDSKAKTETEQIAIEEEKMKGLETLEKEEEELK